MSELKPCPDCGTPPTVRNRQNVYGMISGIVIECLNPECRGIRHGIVNRYAYNDVVWNALAPVAP